ncbi:Calcineurin-like phosphoesterase [Poriferisphaera corsica]|uniref:Calcineurin-like phosphoesterase n=1 Tax=Poriferisphaera corsica TaxID=2528020 RepID=A0A517YRA5_9BACT|nr:metallophosphoesterase [Poriferisphaera corsica]QDU32721.1 Calcineurin-like phosphoesterase [Poriferisphaera corsica]
MKSLSYIPALLALLLLTLTTTLNAAADRLPFSPDQIPVKPKGENATRFIVLSDANSSYGETTYRKDVRDLIRLTTQHIKPDLVISAGDLIAAQKRGFGQDILNSMWQGFDNAVYLPLKRAAIPFAPTPGNHDASGYPAFKIDCDVFRARWQDPNNKPPLNFVGWLNDFPTYYAHSVNNILFLSLNITTMEPLDSQQWAFIEEALANANNFDHVFVTAHVPPYPIAHGRETQCMTPDDAARITKLFADNNVSVFFTGHHHAYYKARKKGLNLISLNACGNGPRKLIGTTEPQKQSLIVVDIVDKKITNVFALKSNSTIFEDKSLPDKLQYENITLHRFDSQDPDTEPEATK